MEEGRWDAQGPVGYKDPWSGSQKEKKLDKGSPSRCHIPIVTGDVTGQTQTDLGYILHHQSGHKSHGWYR